MEELPDEVIEDAEVRSVAVAHTHDGVTAQDGTLEEHLVGVHGLDVEPALSPTTVQGLHDRLHAVTKAADD